MKEAPIELIQRTLPDLGTNTNYDLRQFTGSESFHSLKPLSFRHIISEGAKHLFENGGAWLVQDICIYHNHEPKLKNEEWLSCKFIRPDRRASGELVITDGNQTFYMRSTTACRYRNRYL